MKKEKVNKLENQLTLIAKSSIIVLITILLSKIFTYIYRIIIARYYGPEVYGLFSLAVMISGWFIVVASLGLSRGLLRYISIYAEKKQIKKIRYILKKSLSLSFLTSIVFGLILFLSSEFIALHIFKNSDLIIFLKLFSIVIPLTVLLNALLSVIQAFEKIFWRSFIFNVLDNLMKAVSLIIFVIIGFKVNAVIFSYILGIGSALFAAYLVCKLCIPDVFGKCDLAQKTKSKIFKEFFCYSLPFLFFGLIVTIFYWIDSFIIGFFKTAEDVGFYSAAVNIAFLLTLTPELFMQLFFPMIAKEYSRKNMNSISEISKQVGKWIFILNFPILVLILLFPGSFIGALFGSQYLIAENSLRLLVIGVFLSSLCTISSQLLSIAGKSKLMLFDTIVASLSNVVLGVVLVPRYGINGAAVATMISLTFLNLLFIFQTKHLFSVIPLRRKMLRIVLVTIIPVLLLILIREHFRALNLFSLVLLVLFFFLAYTILILLTSCLDKNDIMIFKFIKNKLLSLSGKQGLNTTSSISMHEKGCMGK